MADLFGAIKDAWGANEAEKAAKRTAKANAQARQQGMDLAAGMDYTPTLASDHIGPYQRSRSPVADAFLDSFLTGSNPAAVSSTRAGAGRQKHQAQQAFDQNYGGWDKLRAEQAKLQQSTPWQVKPFDKPVVTDAQRFQGANSFLAKEGLKAEDVALLERAGLKLDPTTGELMKGTKNLGSLNGVSLRQGAFANNPGLLRRYVDLMKQGKNAEALFALIGAK